MIDMTISIKSGRELSGDQATVEAQKAKLEEKVRENQLLRERKFSSNHREPYGARTIFEKNHRAKMRMLQQLLHMGFSKESAERILNINLNNDSSF